MHPTPNNIFRILLFLIGAGSSIDFFLIGRISASEILAFVCVPFFFLSYGSDYTNKNFKLCLGLLGLYFVGTAIADFINDVPFLFSARSLARPVFILGFLLFFIPILRRDPLALIYMVYGGVLSGIYRLLRPSAMHEEAAMSLLTDYSSIVFRVQPVIAAGILAVAIYLYPKNRLYAAGSFFIATVIFAGIGGARNTTLMWFLATTVILVIWFFKNKSSHRIAFTKARLVGLGVVLLVGGLIGYFAYLYAAPQGHLGEEQRVKFEQQANTDLGPTPWGFFFSGRPQVWGAFLGIKDRPLVGFGSWRHDLTAVYTAEAILSVSNDPGIANRIFSGGDSGGAGHSVLFQAWVENGILPAIALIWLYVIVIKVFLFNIRFENRLTPYFILTFMTFSWAFFFSPPGLSFRFFAGLCLAFYVVFMDKQRPLSWLPLMSK
ncbi:MAG: hypothetical protein LAT58_08340 [Opitutales bacterium]|nr:hypothetical protein [Opitutales bacterium]